MKPWIEKLFITAPFLFDTETLGWLLKKWKILTTTLKFAAWKADKKRCNTFTNAT